MSDLYKSSEENLKTYIASPQYKEEVKSTHATEWCEKILQILTQRKEQIIFSIKELIQNIIKASSDDVSVCLLILLLNDVRFNIERQFRNYQYNSTDKILQILCENALVRDHWILADDTLKREIIRLFVKPVTISSIKTLKKTILDSKYSTWHCLGSLKLIFNNIIRGITDEKLLPYNNIANIDKIVDALDRYLQEDSIFLISKKPMVYLTLQELIRDKEPDITDIDELFLSLNKLQKTWPLWSTYVALVTCYVRFTALMNSVEISEPDTKSKLILYIGLQATETSTWRPLMREFGFPINRLLSTDDETSYKAALFLRRNMYKMRCTYCETLRRLIDQYIDKTNLRIQSKISVPSPEVIVPKDTEKAFTQESSLKQELPSWKAKLRAWTQTLTDWGRRVAQSLFVPEELSKEKRQSFITAFQSLGLQEKKNFFNLFLSDKSTATEKNFELKDADVDYVFDHYGLLFRRDAKMRDFRLKITRWLGMSAIKLYFDKILKLQLTKAAAIAASAGVSVGVLHTLSHFLLSSDYRQFSESTQALLDHAGIPIDMVDVAQQLAAGQERFGPLLKDINPLVLSQQVPVVERPSFIRAKFPYSVSDQNAFREYMENVDKSNFLTQWTEYKSVYDAYQQDPTPEHASRLQASQEALDASAYILSEADGMIIDVTRLDPKVVANPQVDLSNPLWRNMLLWGSLTVAFLIGAAGIYGWKQNYTEMQKKFDEQDTFAETHKDTLKFPPRAITRHRPKIVWPTT